ncbi:MAG: porin [Deltaproteobacteria bacterium]|nr:porin [Deltaproteobacteria bacterium]
MKKLMLRISIMVVFFCFAAAGHAPAMETLGGVQIHGFISQGFLISDEYNYLSHDSKKGSFQYNEMGINFSKDVTDKLRIGVQVFSRDLGDAANNKVTIDWAYGDYKWRDWLGLRAGRIKLPFALYTETRDMDMLRTSIVMPQGMYNDLTRDAGIALNGVGLYGYVPIGVAGSLDYYVLGGAMNMDLDSGLGKYTNSQLTAINGEINGQIDAETAYAGRLRWNTPLSGLALNVTASKVDMKYPIMANIPGLGNVQMQLESETFVNIIGVEYTWKDLLLAVEYKQQDSDSTTTSILGTNVSSKTTEAYYLSAAYRLTDWLEVGSYYSVTYPDNDDRDGDKLKAAGQPDHGAWQKDLALSVRFDINPNWCFKIEGHQVNGTAEVLALDNPTRNDKTWSYFAAKATFSF